MLIALWAGSVGSRVVYLHEFRVWCEVCLLVLGVVLVVEPVVSFLRDEAG